MASHELQSQWVMLIYRKSATELYYSICVANGTEGKNCISKKKRTRKVNKFNIMLAGGDDVVYYWQENHGKPAVEC